MPNPLLAKEQTGNRLAHRGALVASVIAAIAIAASLMAGAADRRPARLGELWIHSAPEAARVQRPFREGLRELGYVEGHNVAIFARYADTDFARLPALVAELIALDVDVLFLPNRAVPAAKRASTTVPIVTAGFWDPVAEGLVASLARPGGNLTGLSWQSPETSAKRLELILQLLPGLKRAALLFEPSDAGALLEASALRSTAGGAGVRIRAFEVRSAPDLGVALTAIEKHRPQALIVGHSALTVQYRERLSSFAILHRLPLVSEGSVFAEAGALLTYGPNVADIFKRAAYYVDRILKGAKPGDLPIEQPTKFDLVVNLKTANALGLRIPQSILLRADRVIQ